MGDCCLFCLPIKKRIMKKNFYYYRALRLRQDIDEIHKKAGSVEELVMRALRVIQKCLLDIKEHALHHDFETTAEEMLFFKVIKPDLSSRRIYYMELFSWWKDRPKEASGEVQKAYWMDKLKMMDAYCGTYREFSKARESDLMRFVHELGAPENHRKLDPREFPDDRNGGSFSGGLRFSDSDDEIAARIMAFSRLSHFCLRQVEKLSRAADDRAGGETVVAG